MLHNIQMLVSFLLTLWIIFSFSFICVLLISEGISDPSLRMPPPPPEEDTQELESEEGPSWDFAREKGEWTAINAPDEPCPYDNEHIHHQAAWYGGFDECRPNDPKRQAELWDLAERLQVYYGC